MQQICVLSVSARLALHFVYHSVFPFFCLLPTVSSFPEVFSIPTHTLKQMLFLISPFWSSQLCSFEFDLPSLSYTSKSPSLGARQTSKYTPIEPSTREAQQAGVVSGRD
ncbi:hypothetical protein VTK73DRAFT_9623 [Phialemonium thermophilum]|uniref:Secreted protein n=1 Tax=Phialemonium thermophilum TaxID=223376 RepID=A0ABR3XKB1_9PEZI